MFPKEHGAYGQLLFPIATAVAIGRFTPAAVALALASVCAFIAHEPLLVLLGQRGPRAARDQRRRAWRWFVAFAGAALLFGAIAVATVPVAARIPLASTALLALALAAFIYAGREHTVLGESWMSATMGAFAAPLALAADASQHGAFTVAAAFVGAFVAPTVAVHAVIAFTRKPPAYGKRLGSLVVTAATIALASAAVFGGLIVMAALWAAAPAWAAAFVLAARPPSARRLRVVGWTLVATSTAAALILIVNLPAV